MKGILKIKVWRLEELVRFNTYSMRIHAVSIKLKHGYILFFTIWHVLNPSMAIPEQDLNHICFI
jgi:hypothetical protein